LAINLATKFEAKTSDLIVARRKSKEFTNQDWSWDGVNAIIVSTLSDPTIGNYDPSASANRYGNASEVEDTQQTWTLTRDRAWTKTMDKKNQMDAMTLRQPGKYLAQATKNVLVPEIDTFIFQSVATTAAVYSRDNIVADAATTASNAWTNLTAIGADITDHEAPEEGRLAAMTAAYYNFLKQSGFILASDIGQKTRQSGDLGTVDNNKVVIVPSARMPTTSGAIDLIISHPSATVAPEKLIDYTLHSNPPGISGDLLEYRHRYDAFTDVNRVYSVGLHAVS
jgi:hypothetical protein